MSTAGRAQMLAAFADARGYCADGDYSPKMWLFHRTRVTKGCAAGHVGWARRAAAHPRVVAALGAAEISVSWARSICDASGKLPEACREHDRRSARAVPSGGLQGLQSQATMDALLPCPDQPDTPHTPGFGITHPLS